MHSEDQLTRENWGKSLAQSRIEQGLSELVLSRELLLSPAQLRDIENGSSKSFHGATYYHRALQKLADRLNVTLEPSLESVAIADKPLAPKDSNGKRESGFLPNRSSLQNQGLVLPKQESSRSKLGLLIGAVVILAVGAGVYLSIGEGWPLKQAEKIAQTTSPAADTFGPSASDESSNTAVTTETQTPAAATEPTTTPPSSDTDQTVTTTTTVEIVPPNFDVEPAVESVVESVVEPLDNPSADSVIAAGSVTEATTEAATETVTEPNLEPTLEPTPDPNPEPTPEPTPDLIEARFTDDCWVEVRYKDGRVEQKIYTNQEVLTVSPEATERLVFGNAQAVQALRQGEPFDVLVFAGNSNVARIGEADLNPAQN